MVDCFAWSETVRSRSDFERIQRIQARVVAYWKVPESQRGRLSNRAKEPIPVCSNKWHRQTLGPCVRQPGSMISSLVAHYATLARCPLKHNLMTSFGGHVYQAENVIRKLVTATSFQHLLISLQQRAGVAKTRSFPRVAGERNVTRGLRQRCKFCCSRDIPVTHLIGDCFKIRRNCNASKWTRTSEGFIRKYVRTSWMKRLDAVKGSCLSIDSDMRGFFLYVVYPQIQNCDSTSTRWNTYTLSISYREG